MPLLTTNQRGLETSVCMCVLTDLERKLLMMLYKNRQEFIPYKEIKKNDFLQKQLTK